MGFEQWLMAAVMLAIVLALLRFGHQAAKVFAGAALSCLALSLLSIDDFLANAVNPGLVALSLLICCSFALERTSILRVLARRLFDGGDTQVATKVVSIGAFASAFLSNTAVVATFMSLIKNNRNTAPGKLLLPLSYAAIIGGTATLGGTSTNLIVHSMWIEQGHQGFNFFAFTPVVILPLVACLGLILWRRHRLPDLTPPPQQVLDYFVEAKVSKDSALVGKSVQHNGLRNLDDLFLVEILRGETLITPVTPGDVIQPGDCLIFSGDVTKVNCLKQFSGLELFADKAQLLAQNLTEVLVRTDSPLVGKSLKEAGFRAKFDAAVVAIRRQGERVSGKLGQLIIKEGDFLVLAVGNDFAKRNNLSKNFFVLSGMVPDTLLSGWRERLTLLGFFAAIGLSALGVLPLLHCLIFYVALLLGSGSLSMAEIRRRFPVNLWLLVWSALCVATALGNTGIDSLLAGAINHLLDGQSVLWAYIFIFIATMMLTELVTNNVAAVLSFPIGYHVALGLGVDPMPFVMAVAFAASGSFISPFGYQTNMMVYSGGYRLADFVRFGWPVSLLYGALVLLIIPCIFPF